MQLEILKDVKIILAEPETSLRKEFLAELRSLGCRNIIETGNLRDVHEALEEGGTDVLIGDTNLPEGDLSEVVRDIRHGVVGDNPFIIAMILISDPDDEKVKKVIDSGADDIQVKPVENNDLRRRITALTNGRRRFVVTTDYIGPDRRPRGAIVPGSIEVPLIKAPNPLQLRVSGRLGGMAASRAVANAIDVVNEQKVERHAYSVNWLMQRITEMKNGDLDIGDIDMEDQFNRLHDIAKDISSRLGGTAYKHAAGMCLTLRDMSKILKKSPELAGEEELLLLSKLTGVISRKCHGEYIDPYFSGEAMKRPVEPPPVAGGGL